MVRAWHVAATCVGALALAALPLLVLVDSMEDALDRLPQRAWIPGIPIVAVILGAILGWFGRPRWLAIPVILVAVTAILIGINVTREPCTSGFCEGISPQGYVALLGILAVWPWSLLGAMLGLFGAALHGRLRRRQAGETTQPVLSEVGQLLVYLFGGVVLGAFILGSLLYR